MKVLRGITLKKITIIVWATKYMVLHLTNYLKPFKGNHLLAGRIWWGLGSLLTSLPFLQLRADQVCLPVHLRSVYLKLSEPKS